MAPFSRAYADEYDALYFDKDYARECDVVEEALSLYGAGTGPRTVLDLGCGTGGHALELARRGHRVVGVDRAPVMLEHAVEKSRREGLDVTFELGDLRALELGRHFDCVLMMFAVLGYQLENDDVLGAFQACRRHLKTGGLLVFDVWYGPAVLTQGPSSRVKTIELEGSEIIRTASARLDPRRHRCTVRFHVERRGSGGLVTATDEEHEMRYFFPLEVEFFLNQSGFALAELSAFPQLGRPPSEEDWNVLAVATATELRSDG
jgi:SAM-dependent methyltransferase